jgi:enamine deaminase RidA (YjgF/YER057c/UK114 family)
MSETPESRLAAMGVALPPPWRDRENRLRAVRSGIHVFMSGHGPIDPVTEEVLVRGKIGVDLDLAAGAEAARMSAIFCLGTLKGQIGDLARVARVVRVLGFINCAPDFEHPTLVMNGFSDLMVQVFGEAGRHTRSVIGVATLYSNMPVEFEALFEVGD